MFRQTPNFGEGTEPKQGNYFQWTISFGEEGS
jgi:hypothetical protein